MLAFIIPVKSEKVSSDWKSFCGLYERTLKSVCNQTDPNFKVVVVCHEIPKINFKHDNIHFLEVDFDPPISNDLESNENIKRLREVDKGNKLKLGVKYAKLELNADYIMTVDSDDLISNRIASFVNTNYNNIPGWYIRKGYVHFEEKNLLFKTYKFNNLCGSSIIVKPQFFNLFIGIDSTLYFDHRLKTIGDSIELSILPFSGGIYSMANGENHFTSIEHIKKINNHKDWLSLKGLKRIYNKIRNYSFSFITPGIRKEFGFYKIS